MEKEIETTASAVEAQPQGKEVTASEGKEISKEITTASSDGKEASKEATPTAYQPNYKFKVNMEEKEFDEWVRPVIKDADTEKKLRKLYEDAYGVEHMKGVYEDYKKRLPEQEQKFNQLYSAVEDTLSLKDKDFWGFMEKLGVDKETVARHVLDEVKKLELPEDQRRIYDELDRTRREKFTLEKQFQAEQKAGEERALQARAHELDTTLTRPEISAYATAYDSARKKPGAFREMVIRHGITEWNVNQRDIAPEQAIFDVMSILGEVYRGGAAAPAQTLPNADDKPLPVIPRLSGKAVSPTGKAPRSIQDLKKIAAEMLG